MYKFKNPILAAEQTAELATAAVLKIYADDLKKIMENPDIDYDNNVFTDMVAELWADELDIYTVIDSETGKKKWSPAPLKDNGKPDNEAECGVNRLKRIRARLRKASPKAGIVATEYATIKGSGDNVRLEICQAKAPKEPVPEDDFVTLAKAYVKGEASPKDIIEALTKREGDKNPQGAQLKIVA